MRINENLYLVKIGGNNMYIVVGDGHAVLIDAFLLGGAEDLWKGIEAEGFNPAKLDMVIITHGHIDHVGAAPFLKERTSAKFAAHISDAGMIEDVWMQYLETLARIVPPTNEGFTSFKNSVGNGVLIDKILRDNDIVSIGDYELEVVHVPGHSPGNICLYNRKQKVLITGDTCQGAEGFIPGWIGLLPDGVSYRRSLDKIAALDVEIFLPAHNVIRQGVDAKKDIYMSVERFNTIENALIDILNEHDGLRLEEVKDLLIERVLGAKRDSNSDTELYTTNAHLQKLCYEGKVKQNKELKWIAV